MGSRQTHMTRRGALILSSLMCWAQSSPAQTNWPMFHGPEAKGQALSAETPRTWAQTGGAIQWKTAIPGLGHSSPVIWGEHLFVTTAVNQSKAAPLKVGLYGEPESAEDDEEQQWKVYCLNKRSGQVLWERTAHAGKPKVRR